MHQKVGRKHKKKGMKSNLQQLIERYRQLGIDQQIDYDKFYLYSLITHSTAIEGSTITEVENQIMFDHGVTIKGKSLEEQSMNLDLKVAYEKAIEYAESRLTKQSFVSLGGFGGYIVVGFDHDVVNAAKYDFEIIGYDY